MWQRTVALPDRQNLTTETEVPQTEPADIVHPVHLTATPEVPITEAREATIADRPEVQEAATTEDLPQKDRVADRTKVRLEAQDQVVDRTTVVPQAEVPAGRIVVDLRDRLAQLHDLPARVQDHQDLHPDPAEVPDPQAAVEDNH